MKTKNDHYDVVREIRQIRKKIHEETKNMSFEERREYCHRKAENFDKKFSNTENKIDYEEEK